MMNTLIGFFYCPSQATCRLSAVFLAVKIARLDVQTAEETPWQKFESFVKNQETKATYSLALKLFMRDCKITDPAELVTGSREDIQAIIVNWMKQQTFSKANKTMNALKAIYKANDLEDKLGWGYLRGRMPAQPEERKEYRAYDREEIIKVLQKAKEQDQPREELSILAMSTGGLRIGALPKLRVKHLVEIPRHDLLAIRVYAQTEYAYWSFLTPEASVKARKYIKGLKPEDYVFANLNVPELPVTRKVLAMSIWRLLVASGIRTPGDPKEHQETQADHSFRKFFRTQIEGVGLRADHCLIMMGQGGRLRNIYSTPRPDEWLSTCCYLKAVERLTFFKKPANPA